MTTFTRKKLDEYAGDVTATDLQVIGSDNAGSPALSDDPEVLQGNNAYKQGLLNIKNSSSNDLELKEINSLFYIHNYQLNYLLQKGFTEWNSETTYNAGDIQRGVGTSILYQSLTNNNLNNAVTDISNWQQLGNLSKLIEIVAASETVQGLVERATQAEVDTGTDTARYITPATLQNKLATELVLGITQLATTTEYFNKNSTKAITADDIAEDVRILPYGVFNNTATVAVTIPTGDSIADGTGNFVHGYNLLTPFLATNESRAGASNLIYKNISNSTQATYLQEDATTDPNQANSNLNKYLFPSNLNTYNNAYTTFSIRVRVTLETLGSLGGNNAFIVLRLLRGDFNANNAKIVDKVDITLTDFDANSVLEFTRYFTFTFVSGESDPYVNDGVRLDIIESDLSTDTAAIQINSVNIAIEKK